MCGITGFCLRDGVSDSYEELKKATYSLRHRGPDGLGIYQDKEAGIGLGHTRLSIIDLSPLGRQPMGSLDGNVWIIFNGEIYNFRELRAFLRSKGLYFRGNSDTEVLLNSYLYWGEEFLKQVSGMFALAIWDKRRGLLMLARDRVGKKPLYYTYNKKGLFFASELKALRCFGAVEREVDLDALALYFHYQYIPAPWSIYRGIFKLRPGHCLFFQKGEMSIRPYWSLPPREKGERLEENEYLLRLKERLIDSVRDRLISDVPLGCLLSGGIDSSLITALAQEVSGRSVKTFTIGFEDRQYDEAPYAREVSRILGTDHTELFLDPREALNIIPRIPQIYDEPFGDSSGIPTYLVSRLASSQVKVVITGDGGDEQFCGYVRYWASQAMSGLNSAWNPLFRMGLTLLSMIPRPLLLRTYELAKDYLPERFQVANFHDKLDKLLQISAGGDLIDIYRLTIAIWGKDMVRELLSRTVPESTFETIFKDTIGLEPILRFMEADQHTYLPDCMLTKVDRASMANGLEVRCPLLDTRVTEFSRGLPPTLLYRDGAGKHILKSLLCEFLPAHLINRPKKGFGVPLQNWFRVELKDLLQDYLSEERIKKEGILNWGSVERILREHLKGQSNHYHRLWVLLVWEMWKETWVN